MKRIVLSLFMWLLVVAGIQAALPKDSKIRVLVITGGHDYKKEEFNRMLESLGKNIVCQVAELPAAFEMFKPGNRNQYDVLVFYHMWQQITDEQAGDLASCISEGKPLVVLHHSICAFDDWPQYFDIIGGKYFHKTTVVNGKEYAPCTYQHDVHFRVKIAGAKHPVTEGLSDFDIFDETYKGYYVAPGVTPLLTTDEPGSTPVIGWAKTYGKARVVTLQSGHDVPTFEQSQYRQLLRQAIVWVWNSGKKI